MGGGELYQKMSSPPLPIKNLDYATVWCQICRSIIINVFSSFTNVCRLVVTNCDLSLKSNAISSKARAIKSYRIIEYMTPLLPPDNFAFAIVRRLPFPRNRQCTIQLVPSCFRSRSLARRRRLSRIAYGRNGSFKSNAICFVFFPPISYNSFPHQIVFICRVVVVFALFV